MSHVFVCYSRKDSKRVLELVERLRAEDISLWIDQHNIEAATHWNKETVHAINECDAVLLMLTSHSVVSDYVIREVTLASQKRKPIVPIRWEHVPIPEDMEYQLAGIQYVHATDFQSIVRALRRLTTESKITESRDSRKSDYKFFFREPSSGTPSKKDSRKKWALIATIGIAAIAAFFFAIGYKHTPPQQTKSVVVLPFKDRSPAKQSESLSLGFSDAIIQSLMAVRDIRVVPRAVSIDYRNSKESVADIAKELATRYVVEGSILVMGDSLAINVAYTDNDAHTKILEHQYQGRLADLFSLENQIDSDAEEVLGSHDFVVNGIAPSIGTTNLEAYQYLLQARLAAIDRSEASLIEALQYYNRAIELDSLYALAWAERAYHAARWGPVVHREAAWSELARRTAPNAIHLAPKRPEGYMALAWSQWRDFNQTGLSDSSYLLRAEHAAFEAVGLAPNDPSYLINLADLERYGDSGMLNRGRINIVNALVLDPNDYMVYYVLGQCWPLPDPASGGHASMYLSRAQTVFRRVLRLRPDDIQTKVYYDITLRNMRDSLEAKKYLDTLTTLYPNNIFVIFNAILGYGELAQPENELEMLIRYKKLRTSEDWKKTRIEKDFPLLPDSLRRSDRYKALIG